MALTKCSGTDVFTGAPIEVAFRDTIESVAPATAAGTYLSPGFIDIQVNGFAGVDYNNPATAAEEIARSIRVLWSAGITRFYPTVITGGPGEMCGALHNLAHAAETLEEGAAIDGFHVEG